MAKGVYIMRNIHPEMKEVTVKCACGATFKTMSTKDNIEVEVLLVDATEFEIERPKKNKKVGIQEKRKNIQ